MKSLRNLIPFLQFLSNLRLPSQKTPSILSQLALDPRVGANRKHRFHLCDPKILDVAYVFVAAGTCLPSRCLAMNVYSGSAIPAFRRHVTICRLEGNTGERRGS
jgi:hypothetical protein